MTGTHSEGDGPMTSNRGQNQNVQLTCHYFSPLTTAHAPVLPAVFYGVKN